jgi:hypothetical protein
MSNRTQIRDYGFATYLSLMGYSVGVANNVFEADISSKEMDKRLVQYRSSDFKKFDDEARKLKKKLSSSTPA